MCFIFCRKIKKEVDSTRILLYSVNINKIDHISLIQSDGE